MPPKNPRLTKPSPAAAKAKKEEIAQKVQEIKARQRNWMQQRDQHLSSAPVLSKTHSEASSASQKNRAKSQPGTNKPREVFFIASNPHGQSQGWKDAPTSQKNAKSQENVQKKSTTEHFRPAHWEQKSKSATEFTEAAEDIYASGRPRQSQRTLPLSPEEFDSLADSIVSRVKEGLGIHGGSFVSSSTHESAPRGQTFVQGSIDGQGDGPLTGGSSGGSAVSQADLSSHKCPFCGSLMLTGEHLPTLVVPCGHTVCKQCAVSHTMCRLCGTHVASLTTNIMLQQIIQEFHRNPARHRKGDIVSKPADIAPRSETRTASVNNVNYATQLQNYREREQALREEATHLRKDRDLAASNVRRIQRQLEGIQREEEALLEQQRKLEEKLHMLREHREEYAGECQRLQEHQKTAEEKLAFVEKTLESLQNEIDKVQFLAEGQREIIGHR